MIKKTNIPFAMTGSAVLLAALMAAYTPAGVTADDSYTLEFGSREKTSELRLSIGKSQIIYSPQVLDQVVIGNPAVADIKLLSSRQVLILGNKPGHTNLVFRDKDRALIAVMDVVVGYDLEGVKRKIYEALPGERNIEIRGANDSVILSGEVSSLMAMDAAVSVASSYVPKEKVINQIQVGGGQQVMLEAKISEVARNSLKEFGFKNTLKGSASGGRTFSFSTGPADDLKLPFGLIGFNDTIVGGALNSIDVNLRALETKGLAKTLAEPNLVALSGQEASFLAGGEIPVPVAQTSTSGAAAVSIQYKEFGIGLKFTPTVLTSSKINMKLNAEVSSLGQEITQPNGGKAYAINTRRTATTIEMADGQSFAIAGLMQSDMNNAINQVPGLGNIPILGALFKSTKYQRNETELVIVVTPRLVRPAGPDKLQTPTDNIVPPSDMDMYLLGRLHGKVSKSSSNDGDKQKSSTKTADKPSSGGVDGSYGHQVR